MKKAALVLVMALGVVASSDAQLFSARLVKSHLYRQLSDGVVGVSPFQYAASAEVVFLSPDDAMIVSLHWGSRSWFFVPNSDRDTYTGIIPYDTEAELESNYPDDTNYTFEYSGGDLGDGSRIITLGPDLYPSHVPVFTGDTFSRARNGYNPTQPFTFRFNQFVADQRAAFSYGYMSIKASNGQLLYDRWLAVGATSETVPAGTLRRSREYTVELHFGNSFEYTVAPFLIGAHTYQTRFTFVPGFPRFDGTQPVQGHSSDRWAFITAWNLATGSFYMSPNWRNGTSTWEHPADGHQEWIARFVYDQAAMQTRRLAWYYRQIHVQ